MSGIIKFSDVRDKVVQLRNQDVLLDFSVAELYGVETRIINQAVKNNPSKFPNGYVFTKEVIPWLTNSVSAPASARRFARSAWTR